MIDRLAMPLGHIAGATLVCSALIACGGNPASPVDHAVGGTLSGLAAGTSVVLLLNGADALPLSANGPFSFANPVAANAGYAVTIGTQASWQNCSVTQGSGIATAAVDNVLVNCATAPAQVTTFAGSSMTGSADGIGTAASFNSPLAFTVDGFGNLYVADTGNHLIRKISPAGVVTTLAGSTTPGYADGTGAAARFNGPDGIAVDASGNVYVSDHGNHLIRKVSPDGVVSTLAGDTTPGFVDGVGTGARFNGPWNADVDASGNLYVIDANNVIRKVTPVGVVSTLAGSGAVGSADGTGTAASFNFPSSLRVGPDGDIYVADADNHLIRKVTPSGEVTTLAGALTPGFVDGTGTAARFAAPWGVGVDASGQIFVADLGNRSIRKITQEGVVTTVAGSSGAGPADGIGTAARFVAPFDVAVDRDGIVYVLDGSMLRKLTPAR